MYISLYLRTYMHACMYVQTNIHTYSRTLIIPFLLARYLKKHSDKKNAAYNTLQHTGM